MVVNTKTYYAPMHTVEHILNQTMVRLYNCGRSVNHHIERKKSKCDYRFDHDLTTNEVQTIEQQVNEVISSQVDVKDIILPAIEAMSTYKLERMPEDEEMIRVVLVGEYDACACSGNHVKNTGEIGVFQIISHSYENGILRLRFKLDESAITQQYE